MGLDDLSADIEATYAELGEELTVELDAETRNELAMLSTARRTSSSASSGP